ncbi:MAG: glycosyltransferase [Methylococcaceae bacterium]
MIPEDFFEEMQRWLPLFESLKKRRVYFLGLIRSGIEYDPAAYKRLLPPILAKHSHDYPEHHFIFLANNQAQSQIFDELSLESVFINHNCLADETLFNIAPKMEKRFDAIHNAVSAPYKRHELAAHIKSLAIVTYLQSEYLPYFDKIASTLSHANWLNFPHDQLNKKSFNMLSSSQICAYLNQAHVGLCLSHIEGAMFASIEYMLAGLPIVSTSSFGGRDVFFDPEYVTIVEADPDAVKDGVDRMLAKNLDPSIIRQSTLRKMAEHRQRFVSLIADISDKEGIKIDPQKIYVETFPSQIFKLRPLHKILSTL